MRAYSGWIRLAVPLYNAGAPWLRRPRLPKAGERIRSGYAVFICIDQDAPSVFDDLLDATLRPRCRPRPRLRADGTRRARSAVSQPPASAPTFPIEAGCFLPNGRREVTCMPDLIAALPTWKSPRSESPRLSAEVMPRERVTPSDREEMYQLLETYFQNTSVQQFAHDLAEKDTVILLRDPDDARVVGFSTLDEDRDHDREPERGRVLFRRHDHRARALGIVAAGTAVGDDRVSRGRVASGSTRQTRCSTGFSSPPDTRPGVTCRHSSSPTRRTRTCRRRRSTAR